MKKFFIKGLCSIALLASILFTSCEEEMTYTIEHDIQVPAPILDIADVYAIYTDNSGKEQKVALPDGKFSDSFHFVWTGSEVKGTYKDFTSLRIEAKLKVDASELPDQMKLFDDANAHYGVKSSVSLKEGNTKKSQYEKNFSYDSQQMEYVFSKSELQMFFVMQPSIPLYEISVDREGADYNLKIKFNIGMASDNENGIKKEIKAIIR